MKNLAILFVLIPFLCLFSCKKEVQDPYPCPAENDKDGDYLCANVSGHNRFITIGQKTMFTNARGCCIAEFYDYFTKKPDSVWSFSSYNLKENTALYWYINYPFTVGSKLTKFGHNQEEPDAGLVTIWYHTPTQNYVTDSSSLGFFILNQEDYLGIHGYTGKFEATLVNVDNPKDKITISDGRFSLLTNKDKYTVYE